MSALSTSRPNVLTSLEITESSLPSLWLQELFTASRGLKHFKYRYESALGPPFNPEPLHSALRMVRATLETLDFNSAHWCLLSSSAKLGPFTDFPRLTTLKTKYHWLLNHHSHHQYHHHSNSSMRLADVLPPRLQQLSLSCCHHSDTDFFADVFDAVASARFKELADLNVAPSGMANACAGTEYSRLAGVCRINRMDFSVYGNPILRFDESGGMIDLDGD
ncbi:hypothetical protein BZA05DRAFT_394936 [Tricharina praecox]|uniref:uncharacterized protein n=1 Tax=Tricharina praecox TaxID=43433 RepID=UPI00221FFB2B|nr:uncharacterized protein BZA05DRAFT_394936 [Tricharina praecox]KAI5853870.1 hypothetical protein BZA05DRAFT_394936 [Tricharina praecox]